VSEPDNTPYSPNGTGGGGRAEQPQGMPFFPAPPGAVQPGAAQSGPVRGQSVSGPRPVMPLSAPISGRHSTVADPAPETPVAGQLRVEDTVVEKIATLAAREISGAVALGERGITVRTAGDQVSLDLTIVVAYGSAVLEVARQVQGNVARIVGVMLGLRVDTVDVTVTDVRVPEPAT
jgi:uncharacterized alkaline shock family protein YloU